MSIDKLPKNFSDDDTTQARLARIESKLDEVIDKVNHLEQSTYSISRDIKMLFRDVSYVASRSDTAIKRTNWG